MVPRGRLSWAASSSGTCRCLTPSPSGALTANPHGNARAFEVRPSKSADEGRLRGPVTGASERTMPRPNSALGSPAKRLFPKATSSGLGPHNDCKLGDDWDRSMYQFSGEFTELNEPDPSIGAHQLEHGRGAGSHTSNSVGRAPAGTVDHAITGNGCDVGPWRSATLGPGGSAKPGPTINMEEHVVTHVPTVQEAPSNTRRR